MNRNVNDMDMNNFAEMLERKLTDTDNLQKTENGALGFKTTGDKLVDLNFAASSLRGADETTIVNKFAEAFNESPQAAVLWLFFARDPRGGMGERRLFRLCFNHLINVAPKTAAKLACLIPEYGRWDDLIWLAYYNRQDSRIWLTHHNQSTGEGYSSFFRQASDCIRSQWQRDVESYYGSGSEISLLAKWLPSANTSSAKTRAMAYTVASWLGYTKEQIGRYRKMLSRLRAKLEVVETQMSSNNWDEINYAGVPSRAGMLYSNAFNNHDHVRYTAFQEKVARGKAKVNASVLYPYEVCDRYGGPYAEYCNCYSTLYDQAVENLWNALPDFTNGKNNNTLVVCDTSGSMYSGVGNTTAVSVARSLAIYFAERAKGQFKNCFISFSRDPKLVRLKSDTLLSKLHEVEEYSDCSNTDIYKVFSSILTVALENRLKQKDLPGNVLIISDMEFDACNPTYGRKSNTTLFNQIKREYEEYGYKLPRLVFWNVASRTNTIPVKENDLGVALVSGFSPSVVKMVMSDKLDPKEALYETLTSERYLPILKQMVGTSGWSTICS